MPIGSDVAEVPATNPPTAPVYCTVSHVARYAQVPVPPSETDEGEPSRSDWEAIIIDYEAVVDKACNTSWRPTHIELEYHDWTTWRDSEGWVLVPLRHSPVRTLDSGSGDALEVRQGGSWIDYLATKTEGINGQYWLQEDAGHLRLRRGPWEYTDQARVRISYRYGYSAIPQDIRQATAMLAAAELLSGGMLGQSGHGGDGDKMKIAARVERLERQAYTRLAPHQHVGGGF